jgi:sulfur carrier protein
MKITLNGDEYEITQSSFDEALRELGYGGRTIATAVNGRFIPKTQRSTVILADGDRIEIVAPMQGG